MSIQIPEVGTQVTYISSKGYEKLGIVLAVAQPDKVVTQEQAAEFYSKTSTKPEVSGFIPEAEVIEEAPCIAVRVYSPTGAVYDRHAHVETEEGQREVIRLG